MNEVESALRQLWPSVTEGPLFELLPLNLDALRDFYPRLQRFVSDAPRALEGTIDPAAIVRGDIISMGRGSVIEAGAIVEKSCRLILGPNCRVRGGSLLRDEVVAGADCLIGSHCDVAHSVLSTAPRSGTPSSSTTASPARDRSCRRSSARRIRTC